MSLSMGSRRTLGSKIRDQERTKGELVALRHASADARVIFAEVCSSKRPEGLRISHLLKPELQRRPREKPLPVCHLKI